MRRRASSATRSTPTSRTVRCLPECSATSPALAQPSIPDGAPADQFSRAFLKRQRVWRVFSRMPRRGASFTNPRVASARRARAPRARARARTRFYARGAFARARVPDPRRTADPPRPPCSFGRSTCAKGGNSRLIDDARILTAFSNRSLPSQDVLRSSQSRSSRKSPFQEPVSEESEETFVFPKRFSKKKQASVVRLRVAPAWSARRMSRCLSKAWTSSARTGRWRSSSTRCWTPRAGPGTRRPRRGGPIRARARRVERRHKRLESVRRDERVRFVRVADGPAERARIARPAQERGGGGRRAVPRPSVPRQQRGEYSRRGSVVRGLGGDDVRVRRGG